MLCVLCFVTFLGILFGDEPPKLPNIDYLASGYDIMLGNPHNTLSEQGVDPGFTGSKVYNLTYLTGTTTSDGRWLLPDNVDALSCSSDCIGTKIYYNYTGIQRYTYSLDEAVTGDASIWDVDWVAKFSASIDYQTVEKQTQYNRDVFTSSFMECCVYIAAIQHYTPPKLTNDFIVSVIQMPSEYNGNENWFSTFIGQFGTHVPSKVNMGSRYGELSNFNSYGFSSFSSSNLNIDASASYSMLMGGGCSSSMTNVETSEALDFIKSTLVQYVFTVGASLPSNQSWESWYELSSQEPNAFEYKLTSLQSLLTPFYFNNTIHNLTLLQQKQKALIDAYNNYCQVLLNEGKITSCDGPPPDPPLPGESILNGMYGFNEYDTNDEKYDIKNPYTNELNCPNGFSTYQYGLIGPNKSTKLELCLNTKIMKSKNKIDPLHYFGGAFQVINNHNINNPMTNSLKCPNGYTKWQLSYARNSNNGYLYYCFNQTIVPYGHSTLGGFYQTCDDCDYVTNNYYTQALSCPQGFTSQIVASGNVYHHNGKDKEGKIYACFSNVYSTND